ncbi:hypothetical protein MUS_0581 [Bacillus velezensis YAU B9601-Y2]|uniref:Uncharacterized protein n=1 Tax=Bacillus amyloliquefaciens (strain Y2) TaxID=1155777 RepID=I2C1X8_BACAY|nr:hypothetical protein MUS_0581 [Bacillus velezensis YAU B9601-Y2]
MTRKKSCKEHPSGLYDGSMTSAKKKTRLFTLSIVMIRLFLPL